ncbi:hypothetical protein Hdeb2414_s1274g01002071 [Helianthus debilis subsp. tardiflorus]
MPPKYKHLSGCQKRKRRKIEEEKRRSQEGAIRKFFQKECLILVQYFYFDDCFNN